MNQEKINTLTEGLAKAALYQDTPNRRERIAVECMQGLLAYAGNSVTPTLAANWAVAHADALIDELDKDLKDG